jgi:hypothetical protein
MDLRVTAQELIRLHLHLDLGEEKGMKEEDELKKQ